MGLREETALLPRMGAQWCAVGGKDPGKTGGR